MDTHAHTHTHTHTHTHMPTARRSRMDVASLGRGEGPFSAETATPAVHINLAPHAPSDTVSFTNTLTNREREGGTEESGEVQTHTRTHTQ